MRSVFQFAFRCADGSTKFIMVETVSVEQRQCVLEAMKAGLDERLLLLADFQNVFAFTTHNGAFSTVEFAEFMADLAGFDSFPESLQARVEAACEIQAPPAVQAAPKALPAAPVAGQADKLVAALLNMGFRKGNVNKWVQGLGSRAETAPLPVLVKDGIRALVDCPAN